MIQYFDWEKGGLQSKLLHFDVVHCVQNVVILLSDSQLLAHTRHMKYVHVSLVPVSAVNCHHQGKTSKISHSLKKTQCSQHLCKYAS
jgi:hypothetical protein